MTDPTPGISGQSSVVRVEPLGIEIPTDGTESIMAAAVRAGYHWPTICGGAGSCRTCFLTVLTGSEHLSPIEPFEREGLAQLGVAARSGGEAVRLACQVRAAGDVTVRKRGVRAAEVAGVDRRAISAPSNGRI
jgi:ferredoxin, 2Fe-2S